MSSEFQRYGQAEIGSGYYLVRVTGGAAGRHGGAESAATYLIDGLGNAQHVATADPSVCGPEEVAKLPTLPEAQTRHLGPAFEEAEANQRKWAEERERNGPVERPTRPPPISPATERFFDDSEGDY